MQIDKDQMVRLALLTLEDAAEQSLKAPIQGPIQPTGSTNMKAQAQQVFCYDDNGNLTADGGSVYLYDVENRLVEKRAQGTNNSNCNALSYAGALDAQLHYDPLGRLYKVTGFVSGTPQNFTRFLYDGDAMVTEYNASGAIQRRFVHGTNADADDPLIWYEGNQVRASSRRFLMANHQGSIIAVTGYTGNLLQANSYDEYGINGTANMGRFQYPNHPEYSVNCHDMGPTCSPKQQAEARARAGTIPLDDPRVLEAGQGMVNRGAIIFGGPLGGRGAAGVGIGARAIGLMRKAEVFKPVASGATAVVQRFSAVVSNLKSLAAGTNVRIIAGPGAKSAFRGAEAAAKRYGGKPSDYTKVSTSRLTRSGDRVSVHAVRNEATGKIYEPKVIYGR